MSETKALKTISLKSVGLEIPQGGGDFLGKTVLLVSGIARGYLEKNTTYGISTMLTGQFMVVNAITGEVFDSENIYLPEDFAQSIKNALETNDGNVSIGQDHPLEVICSPSDRSSRGYTYILRQASTPEIVESKSKMANAMLSTLKALPSPDAPVKEKGK